MIHHGDCVSVMAGMDPESVDAIVTDPPYGIGFMGKAWDGADIKRRARARRPRDEERVYIRKDTGKPYSKASTYASEVEQAGQYDHSVAGHIAFEEFSYQWAEAAYRVAKPSAYLLAFGGTRTVHRMTVALEDAGWIIRDMLVWAYASGFPKSKASLKPAWEPIVMARKPGPLRMLAIDECRIPTNDTIAMHHGTGRGVAMQGNADESWPEPYAGSVTGVPTLGRWPANIVLTDPIFDGGVEGVVGGGWQSGGGNPRWRSDEAAAKSYGGFETATGEGYETGQEPVDTEGTYSRFFLIPKAARSDREPVLGGLPLQDLKTMGDGAGEWTKHGPGAIQRQNVHPTVKPTDLMRHLVRLVTPTGGVVLDPFLGSGTTALAAEMEGFEWIGIEREAEYVAIAEARLNGTQRGLGLEDVV